MPTEYRLAGRRFLEFVEDARVPAGLQTSHQTCTMVEGVLQTFRRRLTVHDAIRGALRRHVDEDAFDHVLSELPPGAGEFCPVGRST